MPSLRGRGERRCAAWPGGLVSPSGAPVGTHAPEPAIAANPANLAPAIARARVAVITGAGRGIGRCIALRLARLGYLVVAADLDEEAAAHTAQLAGPPSVSAVLDVRDPIAHRRLARRGAELGDLRVWVNDAGVLRTAPAWEHPDSDILVQVQTNLLGVLYGCRAAIEVVAGSGVSGSGAAGSGAAGSGAAGSGVRLTGGIGAPADRGLRARRWHPAGLPGRGGVRGQLDIVNMASLSALGPVPGLAVYAATKAAVLSFTTSLAGDLRAARLPIRVHAVCPDGVDTPMVAEQAASPHSALIFSGHRLLRDDEVAAAVTGLLGSRRLVMSLPAPRAALLRAADLAPGPGLVLLPVLRAVGQRHRSRALRTHGRSTSSGRQEGS